MEEFNKSDFKEAEASSQGSGGATSPSGDVAEEREWEETKENPIIKYSKMIVVLLLILGFFSLFVIRDFFLYRTTPPSVQQEEVVTKVDAEILQVPLNIIVLTTKEEGNGSKRNIGGVLNLVKNATKIWEQGNIELVIKNIHFEEIGNEILGELYQNPKGIIDTLENFDPPDGEVGNKSVNVFLVGNLDGINGVSFGGLDTVAVADYTTVFDFRALAHEVGHVLGLSHVSESNGQLMYQGANGFNLSIEEIKTARNEVGRFSTDE